MALERGISVQNIESILKKRWMIHKADYLLKSIRIEGWRRTVLQLLQLCENGDYDIGSFAQPFLNCYVQSVCTVNEYFEQNSICVQMYYVTDDDIRWAIKHGAVVAITKKQIDDLPCIVSNDPLKMYALMCAYYRKLHSINSTIIIGSIGKTTTKRMIEAVYRQEKNTFTNPTNRNLLCHVGYDAQHIPIGVEEMIEEVSEDTPGYAKYSSMIFGPSVVVIPSIDKSHFEAFGSQLAIAEEICSVVEFMTNDGLVIVNKDEFMYYELLKGHNVCTVSIYDTSADIFATNITITEKGLRFDIVDGNDSYAAQLNNIFAKHNVLIALYCYAAGKKVGVSPDAIIRGLASFTNLGVRQNVFRTHENVLVYADCYNAVAKSIEAAILCSSSIPLNYRGRRIAVLGDVEESGLLSEGMHEDIVKYVDNSNFDILIALGEKLNKAISTVNFRESLRIISCANHEEAIYQLNNLKIGDGDLVLFKASHSGHLEKIMFSVFPESTSLMDQERKEELIWRRKIMMS